MKKRILSFLLVLLLTAAACAAALVPVSAEAETYISTFHPSGTLEKPKAGYVYVLSNEENDDFSAELDLFYYVPSDVMAANLAFQQTGYDYARWQTDYHILNNYYQLQLDYSIDGGSWHATAAWDRAETGYIGYDTLSDDIGIFEADSRLKGYDLCDAGEMAAFLASEDPGADPDTEKLLVKVRNSYGEDVWKFDFEHHSVLFRLRSVLGVEYSDGGKTHEKFLCSEWSDPFGIGKDYSPAYPPVPASAERVSVTGAELSGGAIRYFVNIPVSYYEAEAYYDLNEIYGSFALESEISVNRGEWRSIATLDDRLFDGLRTTEAAKPTIPAGVEVRLRVRVRTDVIEVSEWSDPVSFGAEYVCPHKNMERWRPSADGSCCERVCPDCGYTEHGAHKPGAPATATSDQICIVCGFVLEKANGETTPAQSTQPPEPVSDPVSTTESAPESSPVSEQPTEPEASVTEPEPTGTAESEPTGTEEEPSPALPTDPEEPTEHHPGTDSPTVTEPEDPKCWLCGFCPCPLNICVFLWVLIAAALVGGIGFFVRKKR